MSSSIFFKFRSQKEPLQMTFDGTSLSVFEVKRDIIALSKLGDGLDFDLDIYAADTNEKYDDDTTQIPRNSTVIAKRSPAVRPGAGRAARYVTGKMPVNAKNAHRTEFGAKAGAATSQAPSTNGIIGAGKEMTEDEKIQAMFQAQNASWQAQQQSMSHKPIVRSAFNSNKQTAVPDKPLPPGYTCHRCGEKGHWIQACPTNNDPTFDNRPKFKRTTGIPRSFLKVVEKPSLETGEDGKIDVTKLPQGVMYTANGEWVIAEPDKAAWDKFQEKQKASTEKAKAAAAGDQELRDRGLECPIDKRLFVNPQKTPCCGKTYCFECIENVLVEGDLTCPNCGEQVIIDNLEEDQEMAKKVANYEDEKKAERKKKDEEVGKSPASAGTPKPASPKAEQANSPAAATTTDGDESAKPNGKTSASPPPPNPKKRSAEDELENDRKPSNPAAEEMKKTTSNQGTPASTTSRPNTATNNYTPNPASQQPAAAPPAKNMMEFQKQMNAMAGMLPSGPNGMNNMNNMNNMMNPMFNPAMMNMPMPGMPMPGMNMNMGPMGMGPMGMPMMPQNMWNMPNNNNMGPMNGFGGNNGYGNFNNSNGGFGGNEYGGNGNGGGNDSPYMRQPINPYRQRNRQNRQRSQDFRQV